MRILLSSDHQYPSFREVGVGRRPMPMPSGSGQHIHDLIAKGLAELGHEVLYWLPKGADRPLPPGVTLVTEPVREADILHTTTYQDKERVAYMTAQGKPWVSTCHLDLNGRGQERIPITDNCIFVSRTLARSHGSNRYVLNGIDPSEFIYAETKEAYFLFISSLEHAMDKGLETAFSLSQETGIELVVAGTGQQDERIQAMIRLCKKHQATYVGDIRGQAKARLFSQAKAVLLPTRVNEAFGLVLVEALISGTPVICSDQGACPEIISSEVGFVCRNPAEYREAVDRLETISPGACREKALREFHYLRMAADYVKEYEIEIARVSAG